MGVVLVAAVAAPLLAGVATWRVPLPHARTAVQWTCAAAAAVWVLASAVGDVTAGPLGVDGLAGPAAAGVALAGAAVRRPLRRLPAGLIGAAVAAGTLGLSVSGGDGAPVDAASGLLAATVVLLLATWSEADGGMRHAAAALLGAGFVGVGIAGLDGAGLPTRPTLDAATTWPVLAGAVAVVVASALRPRRALAPLLPIALAVAVPVLPLATDGRGPVAVLLAAGAAALAHRRPDLAPAAPLSLLALAAASLPGTFDAAVLLAAAAVLAHVAAVPFAAAAALPGATALAVVVVDDASRPQLAVAALAVVLAAALTRHALRDDVAPGDDGARPGAWAALGLGAWLLAAPHTWTWAGAAAPRAWGSGAVVAATGAFVALAVVTDLGNRPIPLGRVDAPEPVPGATGGRLTTVVTAGAAVVAAAGAVSLLLSVLT